MSRKQICSTQMVWNDPTKQGASHASIMSFRVHFYFLHVCIRSYNSLAQYFQTLLRNCPTEMYTYGCVTESNETLSITPVSGNASQIILMNVHSISLSGQSSRWRPAFSKFHNVTYGAFLKHWSRDKMAAILRTTYSIAIFVWRPLSFKFHLYIGFSFDNVKSSTRYQSFTRINDDLLLVGPSETIFNDSKSIMRHISLWKMHLKIPSSKWRPFCLGFNLLTHLPLVPHICVSELGHNWFR